MQKKRKATDDGVVSVVPWQPSDRFAADVFDLFGTLGVPGLSLDIVNIVRDCLYFGPGASYDDFRKYELQLRKQHGRVHNDMLTAVDTQKRIRDSSKYLIDSFVLPSECSATDDIRRKILELEASVARSTPILHDLSEQIIQMDVFRQLAAVGQLSELQWTTAVQMFPNTPVVYSFAATHHSTSVGVKIGTTSFVLTSSDAAWSLQSRGSDVLRSIAEDRVDDFFVDKRFRDRCDFMTHRHAAAATAEECMCLWILQSSIANSARDISPYYHALNYNFERRCAFPLPDDDDDDL